MKKKIIILFGPPGSGKGTQALQIAERFGLVHISTGDLFRSEISNETPLGKKAQEFMNKGELVPDEVTVGMLKNRVVETWESNGYILDGFPRTIAQAEALDTMLEEMNEAVSILLALSVDDEELVKRLLLRGQTSGRSDDANQDVIRNRIKVYNDETSPIYDYYDTKGLSHKVDGVGGIEEVGARLSDKLLTI